MEPARDAAAGQLGGGLLMARALTAYASAEGLPAGGADLPRAIAAAALLLGSVGHAVAALLAGAPLPGTIAAAAAALALLLLAIPLFWLRHRWPLVIVALYWLIRLAEALARLPSPSQPADWVMPAESLFLAAVLLSAGARSRHTRLRSLPAYLAAAMAALFGAVHLRHQADIASLLPAGFPGAARIPFVTGLIQLAGALALLVSNTRRAAAAGFAIMFGSWIALVHVPRLAEDPASLFEWQFAMMALALAGGMLQLALACRLAQVVRTADG